jgi:hypothetical protein
MGVKYFGQFLRERNLVSDDQLQRAIRVQAEKNMDLGEICHRLGFLSRETAVRLNMKQRLVDRRFGELAIADGVLTEAQLEEALQAQRSAHVPLGEALVQIGAIDGPTLTKELAAFALDQAPYYVDAVALPPQVPEPDAAEAFFDLCKKLLLRVARVQSKIGPIEWLPSARISGHVVVSQAIAGPSPFTACVAASPMVARQLLHGLLGFAPDNATLEDERQALLEFVNVVSTNATTKLSKLGKRYSPGVSQVGAAFVPTTKSMLRCPLHSVGDDALIVLCFDDPR